MAERGQEVASLEVRSLRTQLPEGLVIGDKDSYLDVATGRI